MRSEVANIHAYGAELVVIGNGTEHFAQAFRKDLELETPLYVDPTCASYRALGMKRGIVRTLDARSMIKMARVVWKNVGRAASVLHSWGRSVPALIPSSHGDAWQLGGVLVVTPDGSVPYRYLSSTAGDHPPASEILAALTAAAV